MKEWCLQNPDWTGILAIFAIIIVGQVCFAFFNMVKTFRKKQ